MKKLLSKCIRVIKLLKGFFPSKLPVGMSEFDDFAKSIFEVYGLPDKPSYRNAIATMVMHLDPTTFYKPKFYFAISVKKSMANQVAYEIIQEIRAQEKKEAAEALSATANESIQN